MQILINGQLRDEQNLICPVNFFEKALQKRRLVRSYLFVGQIFEDKLRLAKELNKLLNCQLNKEYQFSAHGNLAAACGQCQNCRWIETDTHPKTPIILSPAAGGKQVIPVEKIRETLVDLSYRSEYFRIVIIAEAHYRTLNRAAATALLKSIEEAQPNTMFLIFADSRESVLSTIISRSQVIYFQGDSKLVLADSAQELFLQLQAWLESKDADSQLEQLLMAEKLAALPVEDLVLALKLIEDTVAGQLDNFAEDQYISRLCSKLITDLELCIEDLKGFIRPKATLQKLFSSFGTIDFNLRQTLIK